RGSHAAPARGCVPADLPGSGAARPRRNRLLPARARTKQPPRAHPRSAGRHSVVSTSSRFPVSGNTPEPARTVTATFARKRFGAQVSRVDSPEHYHGLLISELAR